MHHLKNVAIQGEYLRVFYNCHDKERLFL